jgi:hypothetical protein
MGKKREQASFTFDLKIFSSGGDLDAINRFAGETISRTQDLDWTDEIKFLNRRHNQNDDSPLRVQSAPPATVRGNHSRTNYATWNLFMPSVNPDLAGIV